LLGDRAEVDKRTKALDHIVIDREPEIEADARAIRSLREPSSTTTLPATPRPRWRNFASAWRQRIDRPGLRRSASRSCPMRGSHHVSHQDHSSPDRFF
jgi:hypothetical protein